MHRKGDWRYSVRQGRQAEVEAEGQANFSFHSRLRLPPQQCRLVASAIRHLKLPAEGGFVKEIRNKILSIEFFLLS
jgi:hypothetical protein